MTTILAVAKGGEGVKSGPLGLAMILLLCVAVYFLFKSMSKHLKRVRDDFPSDRAAATGPSQPVEQRAVPAPSAQTVPPRPGLSPPPSNGPVDPA